MSARRLDRVQPTTEGMMRYVRYARDDEGEEKRKEERKKKSKQPKQQRKDVASGQKRWG